MAGGIRTFDVKLRHAISLNQRMITGIAPTDQELNIFAAAWRCELEFAVADRPKVLEVACGSANDYRFFEKYGIARRLDYTGIDLNSSNVQNARELAPTGRFELGNVFELRTVDVKPDYVVVCDLFEHLSFQGIEAAVSEICSVARKAVIVNFFNMSARTAHHRYRAVPERNYYWHTLSQLAMERLFSRYARCVYVVPFDSLLSRGLTHYAQRVMLIAAFSED
jgi:ubiquinone/menaquinone biosynthesis C-methylase UbiE